MDVTVGAGRQTHRPSAPSAPRASVACCVLPLVRDSRPRVLALQPGCCGLKPSLWPGQHSCLPTPHICTLPPRRHHLGSVPAVASHRCSPGTALGTKDRPWSPQGQGHPSQADRRSAATARGRAHRGHAATYHSLPPPRPLPNDRMLAVRVCVCVCVLVLVFFRARAAQAAQNENSLLPRVSLSPAGLVLGLGSGGRQAPPPTQGRDPRGSALVFRFLLVAASVEPCTLCDGKETPGSEGQGHRTAASRAVTRNPGGEGAGACRVARSAGACLPPRVSRLLLPRASS